MIPIGDEIRGKIRPQIVVALLILANIGVFIYQLSLAAEGSGALDRFFVSWGVIPQEIRAMQDIYSGIDAPIWVTVFSSMFIHGGWLHLGGNMLFLWVFGDNVEDAMGHVRFLIFYLLGGIGAVALQVAIAPDSTVPMVGASGAISGVMAAYLLLFPGARVRVLVFLGIFVTIIALPALLVIGFWIVLQFLAGYAMLGPETSHSGGVAYWAHIGGFLTGVVLVWVFRDPRAVQRLRRARG
ncbi:MAG TPA: rhomboid family intramembrane serine protease [Thermomicrobiales bacterium]|nr:rhomboid family intramembrane serine protease [Thermomicrobiales bacterium]